MFHSFVARMCMHAGNMNEHTHIHVHVCTHIFFFIVNIVVVVVILFLLYLLKLKPLVPSRDEALACSHLDMSVGGMLTRHTMCFNQTDT